MEGKSYSRSVRIIVRKAKNGPNENRTKSGRKSGGGWLSIILYLNHSRVTNEGKRVRCGEDYTTRYK